MIAAFLPSTPRRAAAVVALVTLAACGGDDPTGVVGEDPVKPGCVRQALQPGESVVLAAGQNCVELTTAGSHYMVGVVNTGKAATSVASYELTGTAAGAVAAPASNPLATLAPSGDGRQLGGGPFGEHEERRIRSRAHERLLEINRSLPDRFGTAGRRNVAASPSSPGLALSEAAAAPTSGLRAVGDTATLRIPDIDATNACGKFFEVKTRVAHVGERSIILEDVSAPLARQMDETFQAIGREFDEVMWPILTTYFGNPLKLDAQLDANGKIIMLFSPVVNDNFENIAGFVIGCDYYPRSEAQSSNEGEVFYAMVPTALTGPLTSNESRDGWLRTMRSTLIHEAKHITSFVERISTDADAEDSWLEEGTARHAEELYARTLSGAAWKSNAGYEALYCEVRPTLATCLGRPYVMYKHYDGLHDALAANGAKTPIGKAGADDFTFYASAWALVRWAADQTANEATFLKALTRGPTSGVANLEAATGRAWGDIVADWTMAMALDDAAGFTANRPQNVGSWNLRAVYAGMNRDFPDYYSAYPTRPNARSFGNFVVSNGSVRAGAGSLTELTGSWAGSQVVELKLPGGGTPSTNLRLVVTRVQ